ncbi:hypothetical protein CYMTET_38025 [Cymbomonas tetramitiformis]|uniref:Nuclear nucleic acid-binding protein C1D n=1 Tax=Cymbomonas tetramitiformis TaxID=36881 RepID=A0AAE0F5L6_9CHLO|nr:hypothetical protein CYMTET_38027 [Cymbomonas tetramitiformis]KAK3252690.1 hypothetical protein CYMTET_38025 [Cymbomonas tetramitiformis]
MATGEIPSEVALSLSKFEESFNELEKKLEPIFAIPARQVKTQLLPLERAELHVTLAFAANALFTMYLRTQGLSPEAHPVTREMDRVKLYLDKVKKAAGSALPPPAANLDIRATNRFITHAIPELSQDQKRQLKHMTDCVKQPNQVTPSEPQSVSASDAAHHFLQGLEAAADGVSKDDNGAFQQLDSKKMEPGEQKEKKKKRKSEVSEIVKQEVSQKTPKKSKTPSKAKK